ncbi:MAG: 16S rRNA (cytosine(967)-C(5))-methyltransferase RsmB [Proteobacteria bacterium]|nr:16S rRNA (cytosine(967)-C(5))-methyltransferase RsmB [Pseudomonadota bacterium]
MLALRVLDRVERSRAFADLSLHHALARSSLVGADRALCTELVYGTLRWRGRIDYLLGQLLDREFSTLEPLVTNALRLGAYQILFTERIPATAAVDQAVHCTRALGADRAAGLVNAVLRRLSREHERISFPELRDDPVAHLTHALSMPEWIARRWIEHFGADEAAALARASNDPPRLTLRANRTRTNAAALLEAMRLRFPEALPCRWAEDGIVLGRQGNPGREPGFLSGLFTVQDEASQLVVELLDPRPGDRVLDTCAAPGTKSTGIAERVGPSGEVLSLDRHGRRLALVARDARRLGLDNIRTLERDATRSLTDLADGTGPRHTGRPFDRVLVDAPCSGLGALRRNPDARWRIRPEATEALVNLQRSILARAATVLRPGGRLVYSTCTLLPEENEGIVSRFLQDAGHFRLVAAEEHPERLAPLLDAQGFLHCLPHRHDTDGFFAACLERVE